MRFFTRGGFCSRSFFSLYVGLILIFVPFLTLLTIYAGGWEGGESPSNYGGFGLGSNSIRSQDSSLGRRPDLELSLGHKIVELKEKLNHVAMMNQVRKMQLHQLRRQLNLSNPTISFGSNRDMYLSGDGGAFIGSDLFQFPSILRYMPHLVGKTDPLKPTFRRISPSLQPMGRMDTSIVFGLPTVKRPVESYLLTTIRSLLENMSPEETKEAVIIVLVAETDMEFVEKTASELEKEFYKELESGLIEIISPPASYYPDLSSSHLTSTLGDPLYRVRWRTKQNLDFAYLMMYAQQKGTFYVQLEDDVITKNGFFSRMKNYALKQTGLKRDWLIIDFCSLGFIGKMIKSVDLSTLVLFFIIFQRDKPVDWLLSNIAQTKYCRIDQEPKVCRKMISKHWFQFRPSLFQHIGTHSSLKGKIQKLKEKGFGKLKGFNGHPDNPKAQTFTSLRQYQLYSLQSAYEGKNMFWALAPTAGDEVYFRFQPPVPIDKYLLRSGNFEHVVDKFFDASLDVMPLSKVFEANLRENVTSDGYLRVAGFRESGIVSGALPRSLGPIKEFRIKCHSNLTNWVILSEIYIKPL